MVTNKYMTQTTPLSPTLFVAYCPNRLHLLFLFYNSQFSEVGAWSIGCIQQYMHRFVPLSESPDTYAVPLLR